MIYCDPTVKLENGGVPFWANSEEEIDAFCLSLNVNPEWKHRRIIGEEYYYLLYEFAYLRALETGKVAIAPFNGLSKVVIDDNAPESAQEIYKWLLKGFRRIG